MKNARTTSIIRTLSVLMLAAVMGIATINPARADDHDRDRDRDHDRGRGHAYGREWDHHAHDAYYWRYHHAHPYVAYPYYAPGYYVESPPVVYAPPPQPEGINLIFPLHIH